MSTYTYMAAVMRCPSRVPGWYPTGPATPQLLACAAKRLLEDAALEAYLARVDDEAAMRLWENLNVTANAVGVALQGAAR